jgi:hypothetical protein
MLAGIDNNAESLSYRMSASSDQYQGLPMQCQHMGTVCSAVGPTGLCYRGLGNADLINPHRAKSRRRYSCESLDHLGEETRSCGRPGEGVVIDDG